MTAALVLLLQAAAPPAAPVPPTEWATLPPLSLPQPGPETIGFVRNEVAAGRCTATTPQVPATVLTLRLAILLGSGGEAVQVRPEAIGCPAVEQYLSGYVASRLRPMPQRRTSLRQGWYQAALTYRW